MFGGAPTKMLILWEIYNKAVDAGVACGDLTDGSLGDKRR